MAEGGMMRRFAIRIVSALATLAALAMVLGAGHKWGG
jgi:hypothetical protein